MANKNSKKGKASSNGAAWIYGAVLFMLVMMFAGALTASVGAWANNMLVKDWHVMAVVIAWFIFGCGTYALLTKLSTYVAQIEANKKEEKNGFGNVWLEFILFFIFIVMVDELMLCSEDLVLSGALVKSWHVNLLMLFWFVFGGVYWFGVYRACKAFEKANSK